MLGCSVAIAVGINDGDDIADGLVLDTAEGIGVAACDGYKEEGKDEAVEGDAVGFKVCVGATGGTGEGATVEGTTVDGYAVNA